MSKTPGARLNVTSAGRPRKWLRRVLWTVAVLLLLAVVLVASGADDPLDGRLPPAHP